VKTSAWGIIPQCDSAEMAEAMACMEGIKQTLNTVDSVLIIETDCATII
jgi:hypothetical protein